MRFTYAYWLALVLSIVACTPEKGPSASHYSANSTTCHAPQLGPELEASICEADTVRFAKHVRSSWESPNVDGQKRIIKVLERIWHLDSTLGRNLPMEALDRDDFRVVVAEFLAQAIRTGLSGEPLSNLKSFATDFLKEHRNDDRTPTAMRIVGFTDHTAELPFVIQTIQTNAGGARNSAILALGDMCAAEAARFLASVQAVESRYSDEEREVASLAQRQRSQGLPTIWCRDVPPAGPSGKN
jgi:hypothetical protein